MQKIPGTSTNVPEYAAERDVTPEISSRLAYDVIVIGAGSGGLAASIFLGQKKIQVLCIEPEPFPHERLGESLDWSAPPLLFALGLSQKQIINEQIGTNKRKIKIFPLGYPSWSAQPPDWIDHKRIGIDPQTLHVDRSRLDQRLFEIAQELGVTFVYDRVSTVEIRDDKVIACQTAKGQRFKAKWFIDTSGQARLFGRRFKIPKAECGRHKVCLWTYFKAEPYYNEGTTFFIDSAGDDYLSWVWDIPISSEAASVGYILPAEDLKSLRRQGKSVKQMLHDELKNYPRFNDLLADQPDFKVLTCSYRTYTSARASGENWLIAGEAASMPDPFTGNGVTAAYRQAREAANFIQDAFGQGRLSKRQQQVYNTNIRRMGHMFNYGIETMVYNWPVRWGLGLFAAQRAYAFPVWIMNAIYSKLEPQGRMSMAIFGCLMAITHVWFIGWDILGKVAYEIRSVGDDPALTGTNQTTRSGA